MVLNCPMLWNGQKRIFSGGHVKMETVMIIICCLISAYLGFKVAKGLDNNHRELFQAYMDEQLILSKEKSYYEQCYRLLLTSIRVNNIYQRILKEESQNERGDVVGITLKNSEKE